MFDVRCSMFDMRLPVVAYRISSIEYLKVVRQRETEQRNWKKNREIKQEVKIWEIQTEQAD